MRGPEGSKTPMPKGLPQYKQALTPAGSARSIHKHTRDGALATALHKALRASREQQCSQRATRQSRDSWDTRDTEREHGPGHA